MSAGPVWGLPLPGAAAAGVPRTPLFPGGGGTKRRGSAALTWAEARSLPCGFPPSRSLARGLVMAAGTAAQSWSRAGKP